jgi:RsiW-degrading membrane proteinase PrsW (M82 family)
VRTVLRLAGCGVGTLVLVSSLTLAGTEIGELTQAGTDPGLTFTIIAIALAVGLVFGAGLLWLSSRLYAKIVFAALSVFLITSGALMLVLAPVLRQVDTPQVAEYSAFSAMLWFGAVSLLLGVALAAACVRWALQREARRRLERWARLLGSAYGIVLGISGLFGVLSVALSGVNGGGDVSTAETALNLTAIAMWSLVPGLILTYHGISASMGEGSSEFHVPHASMLIAAFVATIALGWAFMRFDPPLAAPMPPLHALAAALPGVAMVAMAARGGVFRGVPVRWLSWRQLMLCVAISMTVGVGLALYVESVGSFCSVVLLLVHNGAFASVKDMDEFFQTISDSDVILTHNEQFFANLITASLFAPVIEEFGKGLGVRFMLRRDTTRAQAFVMGAAAGAGFGFLEAMLYGVAGVHQDGPGNWPAIMLVRGGSTSLHVANTALVGLGWWYVVNARPRFGAVLFVVAVLNHAAWNGFATAIDSRILGLDTFSGHLLEIVAYIFVGVISGAFIAGVPILGRRLHRMDTRPPVSGAITAMQPWMG